MRSRFIVGSILIAALLLLTPGVRAQDLDALDFRGPVTPAAALAPEAASAYTFSQASGTYAAITDGTVHGTGTGVDDNSYNGVNIGFTFNFDGVDYTQLGINANGFVRMGGTAFSGSCGYAPISSTDNTNCANVVSALGMENISAHERELTRYAMAQMKTIEGMRIFGEAEHKDAVVSFLVGDIHHLDMGTLLDRLGIAVRTGHHCAQPLMIRLGIEGTVRASFALYNTKEEIDTLVAGINRVRQMF